MTRFVPLHATIAVVVFHGHHVLATRTNTEPTAWTVPTGPAAAHADGREQAARVLAAASGLRLDPNTFGAVPEEADRHVIDGQPVTALYWTEFEAPPPSLPAHLTLLLVSQGGCNGMTSAGDALVTDAWDDRDFRRYHRT
jgi:ADP-ribose pyrophosphatase YjhB (NUDIX family)